MTHVIMFWERSRLLPAALVATSLLVAASQAVAQHGSSNVNLPGSRHYSVSLPNVNLMVGLTGKVEARAGAFCGHGFQHDKKSASGVYIRVTRTAGSPPKVENNDLVASASAVVPHAEGYATSAILPDATADENSVNITVYTVCQERTSSKPCDDGPSYGFAWAKHVVDPVVFGSASYSSWSGEQFDPLPPQSDGVHRYVEQQLILPAGGSWVGGPAGLAPNAAPDGTRLTNQTIISHFVRAGSDDDPDNSSGTLMYRLSVVRAPDGGLTAVWTPGQDTAEFAFSFSQAPAQIEAAVAAYFANGGASGLPLGTIRVTLLQNEADMPNVTLVGNDLTETWSWNTGNPMAFNGVPGWEQMPDMAKGTFRPSSMPMGQVRATDFAPRGLVPASVDGLRWWGTYANETWTHRPNLPHALPFMINWYASDGSPHPISLPLGGPPLFTQLALVSRYFVDWTPGGDAVYEFSTRLMPPFVPPGPGEYFLSISDANDLLWRWMDAASVSLDMPALTFGPIGPWQSDPFPDLSVVLLAAIPADGDHDGDVDLDDLKLFVPCLSGPTIAFPPGCGTFDFDADQDVDLADFGIFQRCHSGSGVPANPNCQ